MYELVQVSEHDYYLQSPAKIGLVGLNNQDVCLIDSGNDRDAGRKIRKLLDERGWKLTAIYNTHSNADHIGGNRYLQAQTGCQIYAPGIERGFTCHPILEPAFLYGGYPFKDLRHKFLLAQSSEAQELTPDRLPTGFEMIPLPGHFFDMVGFRTPDDTVYLADCLSSQETLEKYQIGFIYDVAAYLETCGGELREYGDITSALRAYGEYNILMDGSLTSHTLYNSVRTHGRIDTALPITAMKAVKNAVEADGFRRAMVRDGVAMVKFLCRLRAEVERGGLTELGVCRLLAGYRSAQPLFRDLSFDTIAAYGAHGAVVHYEPTEGTDTPLEPRGLLLIDSGAHYLDGTTDITRTVALGPVDDEQRRVYTLVLKGHIALSMLKFPHGAAGTQLDAVARAAMWREGMNFMHGTGHGVGSYLNVHEGPHQIRMEWRPAPLLPGMTVTDEPGIYIAGRFGVRIENTLIVVPYMETGFGRFLQFEPLTLCPIDTAPIIPEMLTDEEKRWLDDYHARVFGTLSPLLEAEEADWLRRATSPIG